MVSCRPRELEFRGLLNEGKSSFAPQNMVGNFHSWSVSETAEGGETEMNFQKFEVSGSSPGHASPALSQAALCCFAEESWGTSTPSRRVFPCGVCPAVTACGPAASGGFPGCQCPPNSLPPCGPSDCSLILSGVPCCWPPHSRDSVIIES